jgi:ATP-dependent Clp protease ATP-binding subunit ClpA
MGISTPIHDALAEALDALRGLDVSFDRPMDVTSTDTEHDAGGRDDLPAPTVAGDTERIVALAWAEAADRGHGAFGTGHLLLALVRAEGPERELLAEAGVTASTVGAAMALVASASLSEPVEEGDDVPVAGPAVAEVLAAGASDGVVSTAGLLTALLTRPWGQAAEMLAALGVDTDELTDALAGLAERPEPAPRPMPRDPSGLLSSAWRRPAEA